jgi:PAS domain S-box-containing protein
MAKFLRILVVEDSEDDTFLIIRELKKGGYDPEYRRVDRPTDLERELDDGRWDLVISDYLLPHLKGTEALKIFKKSGREIPFIIVSGVIGEETAVEAMKAGAQDYLMKDNLARLVPAVSRELREFQIRHEREKTKRALVHSENKYRAIFESTGTAMIIFERDHKVILCNSQSRKLFGGENPSLEGRKWTDYLHERDRIRVLEHIHPEKVHKARHPIGCECQLVMKDGETRNILLNVSMIPGSTQFIGSLLDITEKKRFEKALEKHARDLARSNAELRQFAYVASHDLQEPLRMVGNYAQLLAKRYRGRMDTDADEFIGFITSGASHMRQLIQDLLAYSRVDSKHRRFKSIEMDAVLRQAVQNLHQGIRENSAAIDFDPLPRVRGDSFQLSQVFQNLLSNAIKFRKKRTPPKIRVWSEEAGDRWRFGVRDNGIGFESEYGGKIFDIFQRLHRKSEYPGTGIGLAICKKIVEHHGGRIWAESQPGRVTTFYFTLPREDIHDAHPQATP